MADIVENSNPIALGILKSSLGFFDSQLDKNVETYLTTCITEARRRLEAECGIALTVGDVHDEFLIAMYADWLYRKRATGEGKPAMLRDAIRNRQTADALIRAATDEGETE